MLSIDTKKWILKKFLNDYISFILNNFNILSKKKQKNTVDFKKMYTKIIHIKKKKISEKKFGFESLTSKS